MKENHNTNEYILWDDVKKMCEIFIEYGNEMANEAEKDGEYPTRSMLKIVEGNAVAALAETLLADLKPNTIKIKTKETQASKHENNWMNELKGMAGIKDSDKKLTLSELILELEK